MSHVTLGNAHAFLGYSAVAAGIAAMVTGSMMKGDYENDRDPSSSVESFHAGASGAAAGLAVAACATGLMAYWGAFDLDGGINAHNSHIVLALVATAGFIASMFVLPERENDERIEGAEYNAHCGIAQVSGVTMFASVVILRF